MKSDKKIKKKAKKITVGSFNIIKSMTNRNKVLKRFHLY